MWMYCDAIKFFVWSSSVADVHNEMLKSYLLLDAQFGRVDLDDGLEVRTRTSRHFFTSDFDLLSEFVETFYNFK